MRTTYRTVEHHPVCARSRAALVFVVAAAAASLSFSAPPAVVITRLTDLEFGDVATNEAKQILYSDAGAASFRIDATEFIAQVAVAVTFNLPNQLSSGGDTVPVSFSNTDAAWSYTDSAAGATAIDPNTETLISKQGANFSVYVWVGGKITTNGGTTQDTYTSSLTLDAEAR